MAKRKRILLTGATGTVGRILYMHLGPWHEVYTPGRSELDLTDRRSVLSYYLKHTEPFDVIIHCAVRGANDVTDTDANIATDNLKMYFNLVDYDSFYQKFINIGSGCEIGPMPAEITHKILTEDAVTGELPVTPYALSKNIIARDIVQRTGQVYNLRLWGLIAQTRIFQKLWDAVDRGDAEFVIDSDRYMDYITEEDLVRIVQFYVESERQLPADLNMVYIDKYKVSEVVERYIEENGLNIKVQVTGKADTNYFGSGAKLHQLGILK